MADSVLAQFPLTVASQLVQQTSVQLEQQKEAAEDAAKEEEKKNATSALQASAPISEGSSSSGTTQEDSKDSDFGENAGGRGEKLNIKT